MRRIVSKIVPNKFGRLLLTLDPNPNLNSFRLDHGSVDEFYISLDEPHKSWAPGEEISGQVILRSRKNLANIVITFTLAGYVKIHALPHLKLRPTKTVLCLHTIQIYGPKSGASGISSAQQFVNGLYKGEHRFPFIVKLPNKRVFTSVDFGKGVITYVLQTHLGSAASMESQKMSANEISAPSASSGTAFLPALSPLSTAKGTLAKIYNPAYFYEKAINLVNPLDVSHLPAPKKKRLIIKNPRKGKLLRVQPFTSTVNTFGTACSLMSSDTDSVAPAGLPGPSTEVLASTSSIPDSLPTSPFRKLPADTIAVSMELAQRGYLRGELIPIKLSIRHLRPIQDATGIVVTLVRVCRIDYGPDGSCESFRKDLQQLVVPLFVDRTTFTLEISTSVRVPPDAFPTISGCPLVNFKYFIEVMLNLSGKTLGLCTPQEQSKTCANETTQALLSFRAEYINTDKLKRLKKLLQMTTEVVIGTHRLALNEALPGRAELNIITCSHDHSDISDTDMAANSSVNTFVNTETRDLHIIADSSTNAGGSPVLKNLQSTPYLLDKVLNINSPAYDIISTQSMVVPRPDLLALSEKQRMQQHEASLLPSAPDLDDSCTEASVDARSGNAPNEHSPVAVPENYTTAGTAHMTADANQDFSEFAPADNSLSMYHLPGIHEGIGLEEATDYVPKYSPAENN